MGTEEIRALVPKQPAPPTSITGLLPQCTINLRGALRRSSEGLSSTAWCDPGQVFASPHL